MNKRMGIRKGRWLLMGAGLVLGLLVVGPRIPVREVEGWVCPVSGSRRIQTTWLTFWSREKTETTSLEKWIRKRDASFQPRWQFLFKTTQYLMGTRYACAPAPAVYPIHSFQGDLSQLDEKNLIRWVEALGRGSDEEKQEAVRQMSEALLAL